MEKQSGHNRSIIDQFTRQAVPFSRMPGHSQEAAFELMLEATGVGSADTVLDVACGPGLVACAFAGKARHVTGIDITPAMIEQAEKLQREKGLKNLAWQIGDVAPLPWPDGSFSMVITRFSFHHFIDPEGVFREMLRVCRPGGTVMVADVALPPEKVDAYNWVEKLRDPSHTRALTHPEFMAMATAHSLREVKTCFYKVEMELEAQIRASFPNPGNDERIRELFREDFGKDNLGVGAHLAGSEIRFAYPIMVLVGRKPEA